MKKLLLLAGLSVGLFANNTFNEGVNYYCLNNQTIQDGKTFQIPAEKAKERPFEFIIKGTKLTTTEKTSFEFRMEKDGMKSYSNDGFILLLQPNMVLGIMPKQEKGKLQYFFTCKKK